MEFRHTKQNVTNRWSYNIFSNPVNVPPSWLLIIPPRIRPSSISFKLQISQLFVMYSHVCASSLDNTLTRNPSDHLSYVSSTLLKINIWTSDDKWFHKTHRFSYEEQYVYIKYPTDRLQNATWSTWYLVLNVCLLVLRNTRKRFIPYECNLRYTNLRRLTYLRPLNGVLRAWRNLSAKDLNRCNTFSIRASWNMRNTFAYNSDTG